MHNKWREAMAGKLTRAGKPDMKWPPEQSHTLSLPPFPGALLPHEFSFSSWHREKPAGRKERQKPCTREAATDVCTHTTFKLST